MHRRQIRSAVVATAAAAVVLSAGGVGLAAQGTGRGAIEHQKDLIKYLSATSSGSSTTTRTPDDGDLADEMAQYETERTAPAATIGGGALASAVAQAATLPNTGSSWQEVTTKPDNAQPVDYADPFWGNEGAGFSLVGGRTTALVQTPGGAWFAGTADGGVWRSTDQGQHWTRRSTLCHRSRLARSLSIRRMDRSG